MRRPRLRTPLHLVLVFCLAFSMLGGIAHADQHDDEGVSDYEVLVFHRTTGFRHDSIPAAIAAIEDLGAEHGFSVTDTLETDVFTDAGLAQYAAVVFITDGNDILDPGERAAFERYMRAGGGFVGIHSTANMHTNGDWPWFQQLMGGAFFMNHPSGADQFQTATMDIEEPNHPATAHLGETWEWEEEWYNFTANPRDGGVHVLQTVDEATYNPGGGAMGDDHPIAWCNEYDGGRTFYTALGHHSHYYDDADFQQQILGGIEWGAGVADGECGEPRTFDYTPSDSDFGVQLLDGQIQNPMELKVANDGRVFFIEIGGNVRVIDPETQETTTVGTIPVHRGNENGLMGIELDPDFDDNGWIYLFYSNPAGNTDAENQKQHLSRFDYDHDAMELDLESERLLLEVHHQRNICCHSAGSMVFDSEGNLYVSTGDDTQHAESQGFSPIDERLQSNLPTPDAQRARDARRSSGNTNDLRGAILRITPMDDPGDEPGEGSTYTVPEDNLFVEGQNDHLHPDGEYDPSLVRTEIYAMGFRNPFHISIDPYTDNLWVGDVGPDSSSTNDNQGNFRGPVGLDEWNLVTEAGNFGWPFCLGPNRPYVPWDFGAQEATGEPYDCENGPVNDSPHNTGLDQLPPGVEATIWYPYASPAPDFPWIPAGGGRAAYGGPIYQYDPSVTAEGAFPPHYDGRHFMLEWSRHWVGSVEIEDGAVVDGSFERFLGSRNFLKPHAAEFGPDGNLYMIEWGQDFNYAAGGNNPDAGIYRIGYGIEDDDGPDPGDPGEGPDVQLPACEVTTTDHFEGDSLDEDIWTIVEPEPDYLTVADGRLSIEPLPGRDFFTGGGTLPNVVVRDLADGAWSATVEMDWDPNENFQNAGLVVFEDEDNYIKAAKVHAGGKAFELIKETNGSANFLGNVGVGGSFPSAFELRYTYYGETLRASFNDGDGWTEIGETDLSGLNDPQIGMFVTNSGGATGVQTAHFESFTLAEQGEPAATFSDEFDGDELDGCRWDRVIRYDEDNLTLADGQLTLTTTPEDILGGNNDAPNQVLQTAPDGDWVIETHMTAPLERQYQNAGLMVGDDDDNYLKMGIVSLNAPGANRNLAFELAQEVNGNFSVVENVSVPDNANDDWYLRVVKEGNTYTVQWSLDGEEWTTFGSTDLDFDDVAFGLYAVGTGQQTSPVDVSFDYFRLVGEEITDPDPEVPNVEASLEPAEPDGANDWYVNPVTITLSSDDDDATLEWRPAGGEDWITWTEPVTVDLDGVHEIEYRAVLYDGDGSGPDAPDEVDVAVAGFTFSDGYFDPDDFEVALGGDVTFELVEGGHDVVIADANAVRIANSPLMTTAGETFEFSPTSAGQYYFYCSPHSSTSSSNPENWEGMVGQMQVVAGSTGEEIASSEIGEVAFQLDQVAPETSASVDGTAEGDAFVDEATVTLDAEDATSGVAETHIREEGDEDFDVYDAPVTYTGEGSYTVEFRSADVAGNVEDWQSVTFEVIEDDDGVEPPPPPPGEVCARHQGGATFPDAPGSGHRFFIDCLAELGIVEGYTDGTFGPRDDVSRGQLASFVVRSLELSIGETLETGGSLFPDVGVNSAHGQAIYKLRNAGVIRGYEDGTFRPRDSVTRDQTARYVVNALELVLEDELPRSGATFPDVATGNQYAADIDKLVTAGVIQGYADGTFGPRQPVTRAQMTRFIGNSLEVLAQEGVYQGP